MIYNPIPKLRKASQPPESRPGATSDSDRAKRPPLCEVSTDQEPTPGDRVDDLGSFGNRLENWAELSSAANCLFGKLTDADAWAAIMPEEETESLWGVRSQPRHCLPSVDE
jgi:hypothetical protein